MEIHVQSVSRKGYAMVTILVNGKSYTRHCRPVGKGRWTGCILDFEKGRPGTLRSYSFELPRSYEQRNVWNKSRGELLSICKSHLGVITDDVRDLETDALRRFTDDVINVRLSAIA